MNKRATETDLRLKRLYDAIDSGVANLDDPELKDRIGGLKATRDQARVDADRATASLDNSSRKSITPQMLRKFASTARERMRMEGGGYRRDHFRALAQRVEVDTGEVRIMGSKINLLQTLAAVAGTGTKLGAVPSFVPKWRGGRGSNPHSLRNRIRASARCKNPTPSPRVKPHCCPESVEACCVHGRQKRAFVPISCCRDIDFGALPCRISLAR